MKFKQFDCKVTFIMEPNYVYFKYLCPREFTYLGKNDFKKPSNINGYVITLGIIKCSRSIKNIIKKPKLNMKSNSVVIEIPYNK